MEMNRDVRVDLNKIVDALEMLAMNSDFSRSFVNMHTGRIDTLITFYMALAIRGR